MKGSGLALGLLLLLGGIAGCGVIGGGGGGDLPAAGMERCEICGKDVKQGELKVKKDSKVCDECFNKDF